MPETTLREQLTALLADALVTGEPSNAADVVAMMMPLIIKQTHTLTFDEATSMRFVYGPTAYSLVGLTKDGEKIVMTFLTDEAKERLRQQATT